MSEKKRRKRYWLKVDQSRHPLLGAILDCPVINALDEFFGYFLAGLIDGDGYIHKRGYLYIYMHINDLRVAVALQARLGGHVYEVIGEESCVFVVRDRQNMDRVCKLICNKLKHHAKIKQYNTRLGPLCKDPQYRKTAEQPNFEILKTAWLSGFIFADGSYLIRTQTRTDGTEGLPRIELKVSQKNAYLLEEIKNAFGGSISISVNDVNDASKNVCQYSCSSYASQARVVAYGNEFPMPEDSVKQTQFLLWKDACRVRANREHLTPIGLDMILGYKELMKAVSQDPDFFLDL